MKTRILAGLILVFFLTAAGFASLKTTIIYETRPLSVDPNGPARWQYNYDVTNISLTPPIEEFTAWFNLICPRVTLFEVFQRPQIVITIC